ncbi:MAG: NUDIX domain-containing protein [Clostridia bacterium]|nr:NUDIX domain-containing protein [Clostridia bacterium]
MSDAEYHLVVQVWIRNIRGEWLISRRAACKSVPLKWEPTGGSVLAGEDSLSGALREVREELGVVLDPACGELFRSFRRDKVSWENPGFLDVWFFTDDTPCEKIVLQDTETCDAMWASEETILQMIGDDRFIPMLQYPYYRELFDIYRL